MPCHVQRRWVSEQRGRWRPITCAWATCVGGRRPAGFEVSAEARGLGCLPGRERDPRGRVDTGFQADGAELTSRAPRSLVQRALSAARDEIRHARTMTALARQWGAEPQRARIDPPRPRSAVDVARENAIEGCVRETYGAALALWQSMHASDPQIAAAMTVIAEDEAEHAQLAWDTAAWLEARLSPAELEAVEGARTRAIQELAAGLSSPAPWGDLGGLPGAESSRRQLASVARELWQVGNGPQAAEYTERAIASS